MQHDCGNTKSVSLRDGKIPSQSLCPLTPQHSSLKTILFILIQNLMNVEYLQHFAYSQQLLKHTHLFDTAESIRALF